MTSITMPGFPAQLHPTTSLSERPIESHSTEDAAPSQAGFRSSKGRRLCHFTLHMNTYLYCITIRYCPILSRIFCLLLILSTYLPLPLLRTFALLLHLVGGLWGTYDYHFLEYLLSSPPSSLTPPHETPPMIARAPLHWKRSS
jgi:hypothetical protein